MKHSTRLTFCALAFTAARFAAETQTPPTLDTETFDRDPGWGIYNRVEASDPPKIKQDFGWSPGKAGTLGNRRRRPGMACR